MEKIWLVLHKELKEIIQQRALLYSLFVLPIVIVIMSGVVLSRSVGSGSTGGNITGPTDVARIEQTQISVGNIFRLYLLAECLITPAMIAAYSIVGEKNSRTLEPLLATPVETWQLLLAKSLSAMMPAVAATWISSALFAIEIFVFTSPAVFSQVITPGWIILLLFTAPVLTLTPVAFSVMTSSRFNDPRASSQISSLIFVALLLIITTAGRSVAISPMTAILATIILLFIGGLLLWGATRVFQRENILTQWK
jgi:ABC-2 type transport system permease protein